MARIDNANPALDRQAAGADPVRANEQAWRRAMDGALFEATKRDAAGPFEAGLQRPPRGAAVPASSGRVAATTSVTQAVRSVSEPSASTTANGPTNAAVNAVGRTSTPSVQAVASAVIVGPAPTIPAAMSARATSASATARGTGGTSSTTAAGDAVAAEAPVRQAFVAFMRAAQPQAVGMEQADDVPVRSVIHGESDIDRVTPTDTHVFLEHTSEGAVVWLRDARGDLASLASTMKFLQAESARQGVRLAGLRLNGRSVAWPADPSSFPIEHQQGEDRGR